LHDLSPSRHSARGTAGPLARLTVASRTFTGPPVCLSSDELGSMPFYFAEVTAEAVKRGLAL